MSAYDAHSIFGYSLVATAPSPANSGTSLTLQTGQGALMPAPPFNMTVKPFGTLPVSTNAEVVRVTAITGDTLTITRAQESTTAKNIAVGWEIANTITPKTITDIENSAVQIGGDIGGTITSPQVTATHLSSALSIAQGGTGSATQNFVDLTTNETVAGVKTFSNSPIVPNATASNQAVAFGQIPTSATAIGGLLASNNLSDVNSASTAFGNIKQNATTGATGVIQLGGDLAGVGSTAAAPILKNVAQDTHGNKVYRREQM